MLFDIFTIYYSYYYYLLLIKIRCNLQCLLKARWHMKVVYCPP